MNHEFQLCIRALLFLFLFSLIAINASALQIDYELIKGDFSNCKGQAKYLLKVYIADAEKQGILKPFLSNLEKPCEPSYGGRIFDAKKARQELEFYFLDLGDAKKLFLDIEFVNGEKMRYEFPLAPEGTKPHQTPIPTGTFSISFGGLERNLLVALIVLAILIILIYASRKAGRVFGLILGAIILVTMVLLFIVYPIPSGLGALSPFRVLDCNDGTPHGSCSVNKPYYCFFGRLIENPSVCGCPEGSILLNSSCISLEILPYENRRLDYCVYGMKGQIYFKAYPDVYRYFSELSKKLSCKENPYLEILNNKEQGDFIRDLVKQIRAVTSARDDQVRIAVSLVQEIDYDHSKSFSRYYTCKGGFLIEGNPIRLPYQVLYENKGVCSEKSLLLASLLKELGYGVVLLEYEEENHMAVGIKCPKQYANYIYNGTGYCFIETTGPSIITDSEGEYIGVGKLKSKPKVIFVSDGYSFDSVSREYYDAREYRSLIKKAEQNNNRLDSYSYSRWKEITAKYCING